MDKLFGVAKKKEAPKADINAPTLGETSAKVCYYNISNNLNHNLNLIYDFRWTLEAR